MRWRWRLWRACHGVLVVHVLVLLAFALSMLLELGGTYVPLWIFEGVLEASLVAGPGGPIALGVLRWLDTTWDRGVSPREVLAVGVLAVTLAPFVFAFHFLTYVSPLWLGYVPVMVVLVLRRLRADLVVEICARA